MSALVVLDVFIGLVFIYLLYSLLATVIAEFIASVSGLRARNLEWMIARMLSDQKYLDNIFLNRILIILNGIGRWFHRNRKSLLKEFYDLPEIKCAGEGGLFNKPSYISNEAFSRSLTEALKKMGEDEDVINKGDPEKIEAAISEIISDGTDTHIAILWKEASRDITKFRSLVEDWFEQMNYRASGWYKRKVQLLLLVIGMFIAFWTNLDSIELAKRLAKDKEAREQLVTLAMKRASDASDSLEVQSAYKVVKDSLTSDIMNAQKILGTGWAENMNGICKWCHIQKANWGIGYLVTALAISLGAPFWFDLLNKLMRLRSSIPQPSSGQRERGANGSSSSQQSGTGSDVVPARKRKG